MVTEVDNTVLYIWKLPWEEICKVLMTKQKGSCVVMDVN